MLLRVRQRQEDAQARRVAATRREIANVQNQRNEVIRQQLLALEEAGRTAQRRFAATDVRRYYQYERHLARLADEADAAIRQLRERESSERAELEEAMKTRRTVERLKERLMDAYLGVLLKDEQRALDEAATNQAARRRAGSSAQ